MVMPQTCGGCSLGGSRERYLESGTYIYIHTYTIYIYIYIYISRKKSGGWGGEQGRRERGSEERQSGRLNISDRMHGDDHISYFMYVRVKAPWGVSTGSM